MTATTITVIMLLSGFSLHVIVWRYYLPPSQTQGLFFVFSINFFAFISLIWFISSDQKEGLAFSIVNLSFFDFTLILLGYFPACFVYMICYSLLEQESPTLKIMEFIYEANEKGISEKELLEKQYFGSSFNDRLEKLIGGGFLFSDSGCYRLTNKGRLVSYLFLGAEVVFNIREGG